MFWINLPLGLAVFFISRRALAWLPVPQVKRSIDYAGAMLLSTGLSTLLIGITRVGRGLSWLASSNLLLFGAAMVALGSFLLQERRASEPVIPLMLFQYRTVVISFLILFVAFFQIVSLSVLIPLRLQMLTEAGADGSALQLIPLTLAIPFGAYIGGGMTVHSGRFKRIQIVGAAIVPAAVLFLGMIDAHALVAGIVCMSLAGFGLGLQLPTSMVALQNAVPHRHVGIATAVAAFIRSLGAAIGVAVLMATLLALLNESASAGALSGADIIKATVSHGLSGMAPDHAQLAASAQAAFHTVLRTSAVIAQLSLVLAVLIPDDLLGEQAGVLKP